MEAMLWVGVVQEELIYTDFETVQDQIRKEMKLKNFTLPKGEMTRKKQETVSR